ncbi:MAG: hypothetical protein DME70_04640 [Verrucomicrobia bacterium]|nr:MAG: hypothetical protein DME70_04640 [Verrucomicrobiota bacterium]
MQIYVGKNGQQLGPFSIEEINRKLADGTFAGTDLAWYEGATGWAPLSGVAGVVILQPPATAPAPAPIQPAPAVAAAEHENVLAGELVAAWHYLCRFVYPDRRLRIVDSGLASSDRGHHHGYHGSDARWDRARNPDHSRVDLARADRACCAYYHHRAARGRGSRERNRDNGEPALDRLGQDAVYDRKKFRHRRARDDGEPNELFRRQGNQTCRGRNLRSDAGRPAANGNAARE